MLGTLVSPQAHTHNNRVLRTHSMRFPRTGLIHFRRVYVSKFVNLLNFSWHALLSSLSLSRFPSTVRSLFGVVSCALCNAGNVVCDFLWQFAVFFPRNSQLTELGTACAICLFLFCCRRIAPRIFHQVSVPLNSVTRKVRCSLRALWISVCFSITSSTSPVLAASLPPFPLPSPLSTSSSSFSAIFICDFCVFTEVQDGLGRRSCLQLVPALRFVFIKSNSILCEFYFCCIH